MNKYVLSKKNSAHDPLYQEIIQSKPVESRGRLDKRKANSTQFFSKNLKTSRIENNNDDDNDEKLFDEI